MLSAMTPTPKQISVSDGWDKSCRKKDLNFRPSTYRRYTTTVLFRHTKFTQKINTLQLIFLKKCEYPC